MHVARSHRHSPIREHTHDRVQDPVVPAVPRSDWKTCLLSVAAMCAIVASRGVPAVLRATFQQGFQGSRRVGMVSG